MKDRLALPYASDYAYASSESSCHTNMWDGITNDLNMTCKNNNWMHYGETDEIDETTWFLSPLAVPVYSFGVSSVGGDGRVLYGEAYYPLCVRPAVYLNSNVQIVDGTVVSGDPYILSM